MYTGSTGVGKNDSNHSALARKRSITWRNRLENPTGIFLFYCCCY